jgi:hypothetical protein
LDALIISTARLPFPSDNGQKDGRASPRLEMALRREHSRYSVRRAVEFIYVG